MVWRVARSLERLRDQINERFPNRNKASDGTIGDAAHRSRESDHNAWIKDGLVGVVSALDITHDLRNGVDTWALGEHLRVQRDHRVKYVISNHRIVSSTTTPWTWRRYTGSNPHAHHIHISVLAQKRFYDDTTDWNLDGWAVSPDTPQEDPEHPDPDSPVLRPILRRGSQGVVADHVRTVQRLLALDQIDGIFGPVTENAVRAFQRREKLISDGVVGPRTWAKLDLIEALPVPFNYAPARELSTPGFYNSD